jgi:hypothetical protein
MPGYNYPRRGTACTLPKIFMLFYVLFVLCRSVYCLCVNVYCTPATGYHPNCSLTNISYIISYINSRQHILMYVSKNDWTLLNFWKSNKPGAHVAFHITSKIETSWYIPRNIHYITNHINKLLILAQFYKKNHMQQSAIRTSIILILRPKTLKHEMLYGCHSLCFNFMW